MVARVRHVHRSAEREDLLPRSARGPVQPGPVDGVRRLGTSGRLRCAPVAAAFDTGRCAGTGSHVVVLGRLPGDRDHRASRPPRLRHAGRLADDPLACLRPQGRPRRPTLVSLPKQIDGRHSRTLARRVLRRRHVTPARNGCGASRTIEGVEGVTQVSDNPAVPRTTPASVDAGHDRHDVALPAGATIPDIVGREEELATVRALIDGAHARAAALVLEGEAGIGKSTLWLAGVEHARERGLRVLLVAAGRGGARPRPCGAGRSARGRARRRAAGAGGAEAARARGRAAARRRLRVIPSITVRSRVAVRDVLQLLGERRADPARHRRRPVARRVLLRRARVRAAKARGEPGSRAARTATRRRGAAVRSSSRRSRASASSGCRSGR